MNDEYNLAIEAMEAEKRFDDFVLSSIPEPRFSRIRYNLGARRSRRMYKWRSAFRQQLGQASDNIHDNFSNGHAAGFVGTMAKGVPV